ncbi:oxidoreductase domain-containing protein [Helicobacter cinaedi PAGU611]|uniref:Oxidoreductase domain-containing protein n=4 Tax=Helicobacter cinaedi TaxID=213 RepID=A0AAI8MLM9_9HELI|nr:Gfo/Idh/MocA family oxidoreductase [Helicobacter cinaedi]EFR46362.1 oxidoreductase, NAD-binding domain protein [Helicobacter cinaedi CCUG 18818 = ATCC BAA-847]QOQ90052.1 Gfo/Idh/MocA family oxidoreductase [Helicobacter cinaedi]BAM11820.1 oxidoreductase domain-containing protein [Helicobacter cinaedi PAGU611]BAM31806.1 oxidoreductase domain-containing protein [Helicobacter cinaedi CCUG 18818 = ATCC BAA-847]BBB19398.1 long-chain-fatty-acid--CoA ligase [Helicobacter cinaedi]
MQKAILIGRGYWGKILQHYIQKHYKISHIFGRDVEDEVLIEALDKADSAFIATPLSSHFKLAKLALEHNCNVFVEKPSTATKEEFETLLNLARKNNKILFTDYIYTFSQSILYALQILQEKHIESIQAEITQYGNFYENESVLEVIGVHYISVFAFMQELGLLDNLCVKSCKFLDSKKQSATLEFSALQEKGSKKEIVLLLHCSLLSNDKKRLLRISTTDSIISVDMLSPTPLSTIDSSESLPIFDEKNNLSFAVESFKNMCARVKQDSTSLESCTNASAEVSWSDFKCFTKESRAFQSKGKGSGSKANDRALSAESLKSTQETTQNLHLRFSHTTLALLSQAHNLAQDSTPKP